MIMEDHSEDEEELIDTGGTDLAITKNKADWLYDQAGELIDEDQKQFTGPFFFFYKKPTA